MAKSDLARLKSEVDKSDADKLKAFPDDLNKLINVVDNDIVKKTLWDKLVTKVNKIDTKISNTSGLVSKTLYNFDKEGLETKEQQITSNTIKKTIKYY